MGVVCVVVKSCYFIIELSVVFFIYVVCKCVLYFLNFLREMVDVWGNDSEINMIGFVFFCLSIFWFKVGLKLVVGNNDLFICF